MISNNNDYINLPLNPQINTIANIQDMHFTTTNSLKILYLNARSIKHKLDEISYIIDELKTTIHLIIITETWVLESDINTIYIPNYSTCFSCRKDRRGGGAGIFVHENIKYKVETQFCDNFTSIISITLFLKPYAMSITAVYRPPVNNKLFIDHFLNHIDKYLFDLKNKNCIIMGDFNFNLLDHHNKNITEYKNVIASNGFFICDKTITRPKTNTCIDHVLTNNVNQDLHITHLEYDISDHHLLFIEVNTCIIKNKNNLPIHYRKINFETLNECLSAENIFNLEYVLSADEKCKMLTESVDNCIQKSTKTITIKNQKSCSKPWVDKEVKKLIKIKNYWHEKHKKDFSNPHIREKYKSWLNKLTGIKRRKKLQYYKGKFEKSYNNPKATWKNINEIITNGNKNKDSTFFDKNMNDLQKKMKLNKFNSFYSNIGKQLADKIESTQIYLPQDKTSKLFHFQHITEADIYKIIGSLKNSNAAGPDNIQTNTIKQCITPLGPYITSLINSSLQSGTFPEQLKTNKVIPIDKGGDADNMSSFRPISLSSVFSKIIETCVNNQFTSYLEKNELMNQRQYGFRKKSSTSAALYDVVSNAQSELEKKQKVCMVFFDLAKAFDTIDRQTLLKVLREHGVKGTTYKWFKNYLSSRTQFSQVDGQKSETSPVDYGVIQGSSLGPTLFSCYISSINNLELSGKIYLFADDLVIVYSEESYQQLEIKINNDLEKIHDWMSLHKLTVNTTKTKYMLLKAEPHNSIHLIYKTKKIEQVSYYKYLGVIIDSHLNWNMHTESVKKSCRRIAGTFRRISHLLNEETKRTVYFSLFSSIMNYGIIVWGNTTQQNINSLQRIQNRAIKNLFNLPFLTSTDFIHKRYKILKIMAQKTKIQIEHIHKILNNGIISNTTFIPNRQIHNYNTRSSNKIRQNLCRTTATGTNSVYYTSVSAYNKLPETLKKLNIEQFKTKIKSHFLNIL